MNEELPEWITQEEMAGITAEELGEAMLNLDVTYSGCYEEDTWVAVAFPGIGSASAFLSLVAPPGREAGGLYDRMTNGCVSLMRIAATLDEDEDTHKAVADVMDTAWVWSSHPHMIGRSVDWHVSVCIPRDDAALITSVLNTMSQGAL